MATSNPGLRLAAMAATALGIAGLGGPRPAAAAAAHETASPAACRTAAAQPPISDAKAALDQHPGDLHATFVLADAWSDAGCFTDALHLLQSVATAHPNDAELQTRLRVARSLVGEEAYFDDLARADAAARLKHDSFRCTTLHDLAACDAALQLQPDNDAALRTARDAAARAAATPTPAGDSTAAPGPAAPLAARAPAATLAAGSAAPAPATLAAPAERRVARYSNVEPESQSH